MQLHRLAGVLLICLLLSPVALVPAEPPANEIRFIDVTKRAGLLEPLAGLMGHGAAAGDFDGDGRIDLYVGGFCDRPDAEYHPAPGPVANRLLRNLGDNRFERLPWPALETLGRTSGAVFADLDNDGDLDLYVANNAKTPRRAGENQPAAQSRHCQLFRNDGTAPPSPSPIRRGGQGERFVDISADCGACPDTFFTARNVGVFDYDTDGLLDLFVVEDRFRRGQARSTLFRNKGNLKFEDANRAAGLPDDIFGLGLAVADLNLDGRPDYFVPHSNRLFLSGKGVAGASKTQPRPPALYREAIELHETFAWKPLDGEDWPCGAAFGDLNRDGLPDLVLSIHHVRARNRVFLNEGMRDGGLRFRDVTQEAGLADVVPIRCPHVEIQDFDNDGWPDIYLSAGWQNDDGSVTPLVYRNLGIKENLPRFRPPRPIREPMVYFPAGPSGDFDNDGRLDLFLVNWFRGNHCRLLRNDSPPRQWLDVRVVGKTINRMGIGAQISIFRPGTLMRRSRPLKENLLCFQEIGTGYGYASGQPAVAHFGLGDLGVVDVQLRLPNGKSIEKPNVKADQVLVVEEP